METVDPINLIDALVQWFGPTGAALLMIGGGWLWWKRKQPQPIEKVVEQKTEGTKTAGEFYDLVMTQNATLKVMAAELNHVRKEMEALNEAVRDRGGLLERVAKLEGRTEPEAH